MTTRRTLKINRKHTVTQIGNRITGDTYSCKDWIKAHCGGKWDADSKSWIVDESKIDEWINKSVIHVIDAHATATPKIDNGWCDKCHSYCYGDCTAH